MATSTSAAAGPSPSAPAGSQLASMAQVACGDPPGAAVGWGVPTHGCALRWLCSAGTGEVMVDGQEVTLPFASAEMSVRRVSSAFLLLQTFGAHVLWGVEAPAAYVTLQPAFAHKVSPSLWLCPVAELGWDLAVGSHPEPVLLR